MDLELFESIIQQVAPLTKQVALHLMGDPLVHPKLHEIIKICERYQTQIFFVTNGVLLQKEKSDLLLNPIFRQVNFSLHSFHDNYGDKDPSVYLDRIFDFTLEAFAQRPNLYINYRLWNLQEKNRHSDLNQSMLERIGSFFNVPIPNEVNVTKKKSYRLVNRLYLHFDTEFVWPSLDIPILGETGRCYGLSSHFGILADGTVVPCCLDKEGAIALGNLQQKQLSEILNSTRAQAILKGFQKKKLVESLCQRCQYIERFQ